MSDAPVSPSPEEGVWNKAEERHRDAFLAMAHVSICFHPQGWVIFQCEREPQWTVGIAPVGKQFHFCLWNRVQILGTTQGCSLHSSGYRHELSTPVLQLGKWRTLIDSRVFLRPTAKGSSSISAEDLNFTFSRHANTRFPFIGGLKFRRTKITTWNSGRLMYWPEARFTNCSLQAGPSPLLHECTCEH